MTNKENSAGKVSIQMLIYVFCRQFFWIMGFAVIGAVIMALITNFLLTPIYSSTAKFYVNNNTEKASTTISSQDINASQSLAETAIVIIKNNNELMQSVIDESGVDCTVGELKGMFSASSLSSTEAFSIKVSSPSPDDALDLAIAFQKVVPEVIPKVIQGGDVSIFDVPEKDTVPDSPHNIRNIVFGGFAGFIFSFIIFFLAEALDNTIYSEEDIKDKYNYPIIGMIPTIIPDEEEDTSKSKSSKKSKKKYEKVRNGYGK